MKVSRLCQTLLALGVCATTPVMAAGIAAEREAPSTTGVLLSSAPERPVGSPTKPAKRNVRKFHPSTSPIQHIVVLVQENRHLTTSSTAIL